MYLMMNSAYLEDEMKVKELIQKLQSLNPETYLVCYSEDEGLKTTEGPVSLFEITDISETEADKSRLESGKPWLKFGKSDTSSKVAIIELTTDF